MVSDYALAMIEIHCIAIFNDWTLLVGGDELKLGFEVLLSHWWDVFGLALKLNIDIFLVESFIDYGDIRVVVGVMGIKYILLVEVHVIHFLKYHVGIFLLLSFPFNDGLRGSDIIMESAIYISQEVSKTAP